MEGFVSSSFFPPLTHSSFGGTFFFLFLGRGLLSLSSLVCMYVRSPVA